MLHRMYTVYDKVAEEGGPLFQAKNDQVAVRVTNKIMESQKLKVVDYELLYMGVYDSETLVICPEDSGIPIDFMTEYHNSMIDPETLQIKEVFKNV